MRIPSLSCIILIQKHRALSITSSDELPQYIRNDRVKCMIYHFIHVDITTFNLSQYLYLKKDGAISKWVESWEDGELFIPALCDVDDGNVRPRLTTR